MTYHTHWSWENNNYCFDLLDTHLFTSTWCSSAFSYNGCNTTTSNYLPQLTGVLCMRDKILGKLLLVYPPGNLETSCSSSIHLQLVLKCGTYLHNECVVQLYSPFTGICPYQRSTTEYCCIKQISLIHNTAVVSKLPS